MDMTDDTFQNWRDWVKANLAQLIGGDVEEARKGMRRRGPIASITVTTFELVVTTEWIAVNDGSGWREFAGRKDDHVIRFDLRGGEKVLRDQSNGIVLLSRLVELKLYPKKSGNKLDRPT